jgi:choline kinase
MVDHVFDEAILTKLLQEPLQDGELILGVDYKVNDNWLVDVNDATKVLVEDDDIIDIGKHIPLIMPMTPGFFSVPPRFSPPLRRVYGMVIRL